MTASADDPPLAGTAADRSCRLRNCRSLRQLRTANLGKL